MVHGSIVLAEQWQECKVKPLLHVAVDANGGKDVVEALKNGVGDICDIIECGGSNIFAEGVSAISTVKCAYPEKEIVADIKIIPTLAVINGKMFFDAGADSMIICATESVREMSKCVRYFAENNKTAYFFLDLEADAEIEERMISVLKESGVENVIYHTARTEFPYWQDMDLLNVKKLIGHEFKVSVTGRLDMNSIRLFEGLPIYSFIIGSDIVKAAEPVEKAKEYKQYINNNF